MKKMMSLFLVLNLFAGSAFAVYPKDDAQGNDSGNSDKTKSDSVDQNKGSSYQTNANNKVSVAEAMEASCKKELDGRIAAQVAAQAGATVAAAVNGAGAWAALVPRANKKTSGTSGPTPCDYFYVTSKVAQAQIRDSDETSSSDRAVSCVQKFGYTVDYEACVKTVKLYNYVVVSEKAMQMQQAARQTISNNKTQNDVQKKMAEGDGQAAAWEATIKTNKSLANMNKEQAAVYAASVSALSGGLKNWPDAKPAGYKRVCNSSKKVFEEIAKDERLHKDVRIQAKCPDVIAGAKASSKTAVFANENAKGILGAKLLEFVQKGVAAGINAAKLGQNADNMQAVQDQYEEQDMLLDRCVVNPTAAECMAPNVRGDVQAYQGGSFNLGSGANTDHAFNNNPTDDFGVDGTLPTDGSGTVSDIKSPFEDQAKVASGILDPANAATITPGGSAASGGGSGGGGGGGGSASLGDDIKGAEAAGSKEAEIKSGKYSGAYGSNGGGGFQGIKGSGDDDANPLAGLVESNGGVEEDRSIASEGIDGQDSGLFQKISNKYSQIQNEKRIEASNLE